MTQEELRDHLRNDVVAAAPLLLGTTLVRGNLRARIVEVEAYRADDPACHAYRKTKMKNMVMFGASGYAYIYFNYGVHWMLNITAHEAGIPAAVLIRAAEPLAGLETMRANRGVSADTELASGPGKLAKAFGITNLDNGADLLTPSDKGLHILSAEQPVINIRALPRVGIAEGKWHDVPWRFVDGDRLKWVSKPRPKE